MEQKGLYGKYQIAHADGSPVNPEHFRFVLNASTDKAAREALRYYAALIQEKNPTLADDLRRVLDGCAFQDSLRQIENAGRLLRHVIKG